MTIAPTWHLRTLAALGFLSLLAAPMPAAARDGAADALKIGQPWSRATPNGARVAGGYLSITNTGREPDRLTGGTFAEAARVEVHSQSVEGGIARMAPVDAGLPIGPGETVTLEPGGHHLMFTGLKSPLRQGQTVAGTLTFERAGSVPVAFTVESMAARALGGRAADPGQGGHDHGHGH
ncbi:copper chaperone PCu(A)C [Methylobacterium durans]|uniref:Copper chaperone PCu(A)C n=1 Tax=Methylobacterium durans TaxID=2202825 RepID=A0A2U8WDE1_9HYPH|nr:copper chaperone PCu(A)C [Methylobacterium durans]AWN43302.1 hypothetical protein DK389_25855 [Methylobacterium durans]